ncbi:low molecular weight phosphotyrosine protein phosphatase [bacterium]|nr:low molecular weight phosphotyrosine protein phosphatase [bacterium]
MKENRIMFICLGNICRSPLAEAIFQHKIKEKGIENKYYVESSGTAPYHINDLPDPRTRRVAKERGVHMEHLGQQFRSVDFERFDLLVVMDDSNYQNIKKLNPPENIEIVKMREYDPESKGDDVPDPWYGDYSDFEKCFDILDRACDNLIASLEDQA